MAVTVFIVEPGGYRPWVAVLKVEPRSGRFGLKEGVPASTRTAAVLTSSATTAPSRPCSASLATFWAFGSSVVRRSSPTRSDSISESTMLASSSLRPVSASL